MRRNLRLIFNKKRIHLSILPLIIAVLISLLQYFMTKILWLTLLLGPFYVIFIILLEYLIVQYLEKIKSKKHYFTWKKPSDITSEDILGSRALPNFGFLNYYYKRKIDSIILNKISKGNRILLIGPTLSGKTRLIFQCIKILDDSFDIIIPYQKDIDPATFIIDIIQRKRLLILDDLAEYSSNKNFQILLNEFIKQPNTSIIATYNSYDLLILSKLLKATININLDELFPTVLKIEELSETEAQKIAKEASIPWVGDDFKQTIGSIFYPLKNKRKLYEMCSEFEKTILKSIKFSYLSGLVNGKFQFSESWIKQIITHVFKYKYKIKEWTKSIENLVKKKIIKKQDSELIIEDEIYLEYIIEPNKILNKKDFEKLKIAFKLDVEAFFIIMDRMTHLGIKSEIDDESLKSTKEYLHWLFDNKILSQEAIVFLQDIANIEENQIDIASLVEVNSELDFERDINSLIDELEKSYLVEKNPNNTISWKYELLKSRILIAEKPNHRFAFLYYKIEHQKSNDFRHLFFQLYHSIMKSDIPVNGAIIFQELIDALPEEEITFPLEKLYNIGIHIFEHSIGMMKGKIASNLADLYLRNHRYLEAIKYYKEALKIFTKKENLRSFMFIHMNLGSAYSVLVEGRKNKNIRKAIKHWNEALRSYYKDLQPKGDLLRFRADLHYNIGLTNMNSSNTNTVSSAINSFYTALAFYNEKDYPLWHAEILQNIGLTEVRLAIPNCKNAIRNFQKANNLLGNDNNNLQYIMNLNYIATAHYRLAIEENWSGNCWKAIEFSEKAITLIDEKRYPDLCNQMEKNLLFIRWLYSLKGLRKFITKLAYSLKWNTPRLQDKIILKKDY